MSILTYTQEEIDDIVIGMADHQVRMAQNVVTLKKAGVYQVTEIEERLMCLTNIIDSLKNYNMALETLTDDEIYKLIETATLIVELT